jgi:hypothetical protein
MMGQGPARIYNIVSFLFVTLSVLWVLIVTALMLSG